MTIAALDAAGFAEAEARLALGEPVVIPTPSPLAYVFFADDPAAVNLAKGRRRDQPVGVTPASFEVIRPHLAVDPDTGRLIEWLMYEEHFSLLAPARPSAPDWLAPAIVNGVAALAGAWLPQIHPLLGRRHFAYGSSANATGSEPATTAATADLAFAGRLLVLDGDSHRTAGIRHGSTSTLAISGDGEISLYRHGIQDAGYEGEEDLFLAGLRARFDAAS